MQISKTHIFQSLKQWLSIRTRPDLEKRHPLTMYQSESETFHVSQLLLVCLLPLFTLLPFSSCNWLLLLKAALASDPIFKIKCFLFHRCVSVSLTNTGTCQAEKAFSGCLCMHIVDKPPVFDGRLMGDECARQAATDLLLWKGVHVSARQC